MIQQKDKQANFLVTTYRTEKKEWAMTKSKIY